MSDEPSRPSNRLLWVLGGVVTLIVAVSVAAVLATPSPPTYPADSPEGIVDRFLDASLAGDLDTARSLMDDRLGGPAEDCSLVEPGEDGNARVVLVRTESDDDRATVTVTLSRLRGYGLFGPEESRLEDRFELRRRDDLWRITWAPWPFANCEYKEVGG